jgi:hypothetical protein
MMLEIGAKAFRRLRVTSRYTPRMDASTPSFAWPSLKNLHEMLESSSFGKKFDNDTKTSVTPVIGTGLASNLCPSI